MTAALEGGERSAARPGRTLPPGKTLYPFYRRLSGPQGRSGRTKNLVPTETRSRTVQPVVNRYTNWATGPTKLRLVIKEKMGWIHLQYFQQTSFARLFLRVEEALVFLHVAALLDFIRWVESHSAVWNSAVGRRDVRNRRRQQRFSFFGGEEWGGTVVNEHDY